MNDAIHAKIASVSLQIFVPYPPELKARIDAAYAEALEAAMAIPEWARPVGIPPYLFEPPMAEAFWSEISAEQIRAEFRRKLKKIGMTVPDGEFAYSGSVSRTGCVFAYAARG